MVRYNSTGSISSVGSVTDLAPVHSVLIDAQDGLDISRESQVIQMEMDMIMELHNQRSTMDKNLKQILYDIPTAAAADKRPPGPTSLRKSNSRVSSTGKLRLKVESFRNKNSSGTQTDISVLKKHQAPSKPVRKTKTSKTGGSASDLNTTTTSERSNSPDANSSTSGYSSPSAGGHSKESSPCGSKVPSPPQSMEEDAASQDAAASHDGQDAGPDSKITVIQIVPAARSAQQQPEQHYAQRELPRIATNGTLNARTLPQQPKRKLPDRSKLPTPPSEPKPDPKPRLFRSNLPRPAPNFGQGRGVPLPPVPELDRSDHERESMSPVPDLFQRQFHKLPSPLTTPVQPAASFRPTSSRLPRYEKRNAELPAIPSNRPPLKVESPAAGAAGDVVEDKLRALIELLESKSRKPRRRHRQEETTEQQSDVFLASLESEESKETDLLPGRGASSSEGTLQYLSQLESVARRLKDEIIKEVKKILITKFLLFHYIKNMLNLGFLFLVKNGGKGIGMLKKTNYTSTCLLIHHTVN